MERKVKKRLTFQKICDKIPAYVDGRVAQLVRALVS